MRKHAYVTRAHTEAEVGDRAEGDVILNMAANQFTDFESVGLVREATDAEVAKARGETAGAKPAPAKRKKPAPRKTAKPASAPVAEQAPAAVPPAEPDPAAPLPGAA